MPLKAWKPHVYRVGQAFAELDEAPDIKETRRLRREIEPWLSALFQGEHLSLLLGSGFTIGIAALADTEATRMTMLDTPGFALAPKVSSAAARAAASSARGTPNLEDQIRTLSQLLTGLEILEDERREGCRMTLNSVMKRFFESICTTEEDIRTAVLAAPTTPTADATKRALVSFLLTFAARSAGRERLHVFTTNYDRLIEFACDLAGLRTVDRFVGGLTRVFRSSRLDVDFHYNPPGIRGEPRYLEGVIRLTKLHGSIDWRLENGVVMQNAVPFGLARHDPLLGSEPFTSAMVYPNSAKDVDTSLYPFAELFRDFSGALCRPNSVLVTYGYGFGDEHINRVLRDMLTIPSTHLVIISYGDEAKRIQAFCEQAGRDAQISLLIGPLFGDIATLVSTLLPKPAIDNITVRKAELLRRRSIVTTDDASATEKPLSGDIGSTPKNGESGT